MSERGGAEHVEFIRLNGTAVRVTSWTEFEPGHFRLVTIVRGTGDARALGEVLAAPRLQLDVPGEESRPVAIAALDRRETGTPPAVITRFAVDFVAAEDRVEVNPRQTIEERVMDLEREVARLRAVIEAHIGDPDGSSVPSG